MNIMSKKGTKIMEKDSKNNIDIIKRESYPMDSFLFSTILVKSFFFDYIIIVINNNNLINPSLIN